MVEEDRGKATEEVAVAEEAREAAKEAAREVVASTGWTEELTTPSIP